MKLDSILNWFSDRVEDWDQDAIKFTVYATIAVLIGSIFEVVPPFFLSQTVKPIPNITPYSPLELAGRDIYQKEGCISCHTQLIRPFKWEVDRYDVQKVYGKEGYSKGGEFVYDHPFLWGSKRTGPDLAHVSQNRPSADWHKRHLINPQETSPGSIMPAYYWLFEKSATIDAGQIQSNMKGLTMVGVPYTQNDINSVPDAVKGKTEGDALVAYLLKLGKDSAELEKSMKK